MKIYKYQLVHNSTEGYKETLKLPKGARVVKAKLDKLTMLGFQWYIWVLFDPNETEEELVEFATVPTGMEFDFTNHIETVFTEGNLVWHLMMK